MRALLVVNPSATATTTRSRDVLTRALGSELKLDVVETRRRGHATELARQAAADGLDVVVALGGDGTVNEVVNGLLADGPSSSTPKLAVVPGGSANVFARILGQSRSPVEATSDILDALRAGRFRTIGLGRADDRWFTVAAELGLGAEVVRMVEERRRLGRRATPSLYVRSTLRRFYGGTDRRRPALTLRVPGAEPVTGLFLAVVSNTAPWTFLGERACNPSPEASFDTGLDVLALRRLRTAGTVRTVAQTLSASPDPRGRDVVRLRDLDELELVASRPTAFEVDGDYLGERRSVRLRSVPSALNVVL